jgi:hypothetical protein
MNREKKNGQLAWPDRRGTVAPRLRSFVPLMRIMMSGFVSNITSIRRWPDWITSKRVGCNGEGQAGVAVRGGCSGCDESVPRGVTLGAEQEGPAKAMLTKENLPPQVSITVEGRVGQG